uniref:Ciliogenesis and planar polarity effector 2 n=1 Tax=Molossus molossus TaxID=27622 RepID=A0A7J8F847_MOLMO|nr:ciliogenesis and planar polarity effector 2 [Molossus molossus]
MDRAPGLKHLPNPNPLLSLPRLLQYKGKVTGETGVSLGPWTSSGDEGGFGVSAPCVHSETQALRPSTHGFPVCPGTSLCSELTNECNSWYSSCTSSPGWCLKCQPPWLPR